MTEPMQTDALTDPTADGLKVLVGCEFRFDAAAPVAAIMQVAPCPDPGVRMRREEWHTESDHHGYIDHYSNRCERLVIEPGNVEIAYEAELLLTDPRDLIVPDAAETPVADLPDETLSFIMPSRFCLPDELGHEAWQRFGELAPGWSRVQAIVDYVHNHLEFTPGGGLLAEAGRFRLRLWDAVAGEVAAAGPTIKTARDAISGVAFSPDGSLIATAEGSAARVWHVPGVIQQPESQNPSFRTDLGHTHTPGIRPR